MFRVVATWVCLSTLGLAGHAAADVKAEQYYQAAVAKYKARDYQGAIQYAEAAAQADPKHWQAWQLDGNARYALGDKKGALTVYKYSLQINPNTPQLKGFVTSLESELGAPAAAPAAAAQSEPEKRGILGSMVRVMTAPFRFLAKLWPF